MKIRDSFSANLQFSIIFFMCLTLLIFPATIYGIAIDCQLQPTGENYVGVEYTAFLAEDELSSTGLVKLYGGNGLTKDGEYQAHFIDLSIKAFEALVHDNDICSKGFPPVTSIWKNFTMEFSISDFEDGSYQDNDIGGWTNSPSLFPRRFVNWHDTDPTAADRIEMEYQPNIKGTLEGREVRVILERFEQTYLSQSQNYFSDPDLAGSAECTPNQQSNILYRRWRVTFKEVSLAIDCSMDFYVNAEQGDKIISENTLNFIWTNAGKPDVYSDKFKVLIYNVKVKTLADGWKPAYRFLVDVRGPSNELPWDGSNHLLAGYRKTRFVTPHTADNVIALEASFGYGHTDYVIDGNPNDYEGSNATKALIDLSDDKLPKPILVDPKFNKHGLGNFVWLDWQDVPGATSYDVQIDDVSNFVDENFEVSGVTQSRVKGGPLPYSAGWYWRVRATNGVDYSDWSDLGRFYTMDMPDVHVEKPLDYVLACLEEGDQYYIDRDFVITGIPENLENLLWMKTANDDQYSTASSLVQFRLDNPTRVYVVYDHRANYKPAWLNSQFSKTSYSITVSDDASPMEVWQKDYSSGTYELGGNWANGNNGAKSNYVLLFEPKVNGWSVPVTVKNNNSQFIRSFGGHPSASDNFDDGIDVPAPPPGQGFYAYFPLDDFPNYLEKDMRAWSAPYETDIDWSLVLKNTGGNNTSLTWNPADLPEEGSFTLIANETIDMRAQSSCWVSGDVTVLIKYRNSPIHTYEFDQAGWYLISLPLDPANKSVTSLFPSALGGVAYEWDVPTLSYKTVSTLEIGKGYWIAIPGLTTVDISGQPFYTYKRSLQIGWHLIGSVAGGASFSNPQDDPDGSVYTPAYGWTVPAGPYYTTSTLHAGEGFWVAVFNPCLLTIGGPPAPPLAAAHPGTSRMRETDFYAAFGQTPPLPPVTSAVERPVVLPELFVLHQNYPNPFNPQTTIRFEVPNAAHVDIAVYNIQGVKVRSLLNEEKAPGIYNIIWEGKADSGEELTSGLYFIQMKSDDYSKTLKAHLIK
ncbi:T9SS type A sorting domain-containing protein [candidate division KSB1 bacterium]|nr:T9SS type A sorting domain-containing protein [candidate division KSB1 bacterium]